MAYLEHQIQHFKYKAYYKASNYQSSINTCQEKVDILVDIMEAEREDGQKNMYFMYEELYETINNSDETFAEMSWDTYDQIAEI